VCSVLVATKQEVAGHTKTLNDECNLSTSQSLAIDSRYSLTLGFVHKYRKETKPLPQISSSSNCMYY